MIGNGFMSNNAKIDKGVVPENEDLPERGGLVDCGVGAGLYDGQCFYAGSDFVGKVILPDNQDLPLRDRFGYNFNDWVMRIQIRLKHKGKNFER